MMMNTPWDHARPGTPSEWSGGDAPIDFPQRRWCFGGDWLAHGLVAALERAQPGHGGEFAHLAVEPSIDNVSYAAGKWLQVVYRLGDRWPQRVTLAFAHGDDGEPPAAGPRGRWLADARATAWFWPEDPAGLPLARWTSTAWAREQLAALDPGASAPSRCRVLSYLPGERCAIRWHRHGDDRPQWVMKAQRGRAALDTARQALWRAPGRTFGMPEPLGADRVAVDAEEQVRWERFVDGERLEAAAARHGWAPVLRAAAAAVADLHRRTLPGLVLQDEAAVLARLEGKVRRRIRAALPACVSECDRLVSALQARRPRDPAPRATLHGDLHTGNLLCADDGRIAFIDLDNLVLGSPAHDLALLASRLMLLGLLDPTAAPPREIAVEALPRWYVEAGGDPRVLDEYRWYLALLLVSRQVKTCIRHHAPGLASLGPALIAQAHTVLDQAA